MKILLENLNLVLVGLGLIVFGLSIYLGFLVVKLKAQAKEHAKMQAQLDEEIKKQDVYYKESLMTIAKATLQGQCELSECCIRIKKILEFYPEIEKDPGLITIQLMYEEIKVFPTHGERLKLSKQDVFNQDKKRFKIEAKYQDDMHKALELLVSKQLA